MTNQLLDHSESAFRGYLKRPIPVAADFALEQQVLALSRRELEDARSSSSLEDAQVFNAFAQRAAVRAVRDSDVTPIVAGLLALSIGGVLDYRENTMVLALLAHSAEKVGTDLVSILRANSSRIPTKALERFEDVASWTETERSIRLMGFAESGVGDQFVYVSRSPWA